MRNENGVGCAVATTGVVGQLPVVIAKALAFRYVSKVAVSLGISHIKVEIDC